MFNLNFNESNIDVIEMHGLNDILITSLHDKIKNTIKLNNKGNSANKITEIIFCFDDGLRSIFTYKDKLLSYKNKYEKDIKITYLVGINPYFVIKSDKSKIKNYEYIRCFKAHENALKGNFSNYLNTDELITLDRYGFINVLHSYDHFINLYPNFNKTIRVLSKYENKFNIKDKKLKNYIINDIEKQFSYLFDKYNPVFRNLYMSDIFYFIQPFNIDLIYYKGYLNNILSNIIYNSDTKEATRFNKIIFLGKGRKNLDVW